MPQGNWIRGAVALLLLSALAGCAGNQQPTVQARAPERHSRPASYAPPGPPGDPWGPWIREAARRYDVPERWIREVMRQESGGRSTATSHAGAMGLMQVMPGTYRELRSRYGLGDDPYHPYDSIMAGTAYLREMYELYGSPAFLAAYNAGPRRLEDYLWNNRGLPNETRNYVARIGPGVIGHHPTRRAPPEVYAAAEIPVSIPAGPRRMDGATMLALREQRESAQPAVQPTVLAGPVRRMDPIVDGSTQSYQVASVRVGGSGPVVRMEPIPDGTTPQGAARLAEAAGRVEAPPPMPPPAAVLPVAPTYSAPGPAPVRLAALPTPPAPVPAERASVLRMTAVAAPLGRGVSLPPPVPARHGFGLIASAQAASLPVGTGPRGTSVPSGGWGVQVGAFAGEAQARAAAGTARDAAGLLGARTAVLPVDQGRNRLYRARVTGLSQAQAQSLCDRMRSRGGCAMVAPGS